MCFFKPVKKLSLQKLFPLSAASAAITPKNNFTITANYIRCTRRYPVKYTRIFICT